MQNNIALKILKGLLNLSPRTGKREEICLAWLSQELTKSGVDFKIEKFHNQIPSFTKATLIADKKTIPCKGACFHGGTFSDKSNIISSWVESNHSNINFNPWSDQISQANIYRKPAVAVSRLDLPKILSAKNIKVTVQVKPEKFISGNILIGNSKNPQNIVFCHFDSIETGAIDNASGTAVTMATLIENPDLLTNNLFVLAGSEELSYDQKPAYWGKGYREFEKKNGKILKSAKKIWVIDSLGNGPTKITSQGDLVYLAFPLKNPKTVASKVSIVHGDMEHLMTVYHSHKDDIKLIDNKYLNQAVSLLKKHLM